MSQPERNPAALRKAQLSALETLTRAAEASRSFQEFADLVVGTVRETFQVDYCKILELLPDGKELLLRAGVGWLPGLVGVETVGTDWQSQAGYTLLKKRPIIVEDMHRERRFIGPPLLHLHRVVSGLSCPIPGRGRPYGVIGVHSRSYAQFGETDARFLVGVAQLVALAAERHDSGHAEASAATASRSG